MSYGIEGCTRGVSGFWVSGNSGVGVRQSSNTVRYGTVAPESEAPTYSVHGCVSLIATVIHLLYDYLVPYPTCNCTWQSNCTWQRNTQPAG